MFAAGHEFLVYDLGGVITTGVDVDALLDDRVGAGTQGLAYLVATGLYLRAWFAGRAIIGVACGSVHCRGRREAGGEEEGGVRGKGGYTMAKDWAEFDCARVAVGEARLAEQDR